MRKMKMRICSFMLFVKRFICCESGLLWLCKSCGNQGVSDLLPVSCSDCGSFYVIQIVNGGVIDKPYTE